jgi:crossover junction endodeoxyribonuclease RuvC
MTCLLAIDPGLTGALAFYLPISNPDRVAVYDMPIVGSEINAAALRDLIDSYKPTYAIIEQVGPMPRDGVRQAWRFSAAYTTARTVVALLNIPMTLVVPGRWKKAMNVRGGPDGKEACRALAIQSFPCCAASFSRKKDAGRAESALLALYAAKTFHEIKAA